MKGRVGRRGNHEGSISKRQDGRWLAQVSLPDGRRRSAYARTRDAAALALQRLQREAESGLPAPPERLTVGTFFNQWLEQVTPRLRESTARRYRQLVTHQILPTWGRTRLRSLSPQDVEAGLATLHAAGLSPRTCAHVRAVMRAALHDAQRWGVLASNSAALASAPRVPHTAPRVLTPSEAHAVLAALEDASLHRLASLAIHTGLRQGELLGLRWQDVDFHRQELHVTQSLQRIGGEYRLVEVKSSTSRRTIPLTGTASTALQEERDAQADARASAGRRWLEPLPGLVFTTRLGRPRNGTAITHSLEASLERSSIPPMRWHHLRHAYAGLMLGSGADLATVSHLLGHTSVALTASTYAGLLPSLKRQAAERLGQLLEPPDSAGASIPGATPGPLPEGSIREASTRPGI